MVMFSEETQIQILANWPISHAKRGTKENRKNPEYHVVAAIRKLQADKDCPAEKLGPDHVKNEQHIGSEKTYGTIYEPRQHFRLWSFASSCLLSNVFVKDVSACKTP